MNEKQTLDKYTSISYGFEHLVASIDHMEDSGLLETEFSKLPGSAMFPITVGKSDSVAKKNRWKEVVPYDHNRVMLCHSDANVIDVDGDYINASFIRGFRNKDGYIATQGPMLGTVEDFWNLVWAENNRLLVMMCRLVERCQNQSYKYWPDVGDCIDVDNITVSTDLEDDRGTYVIRKCLLQHSKTGEVRQITQLQFLAWPDNSLPCLPTFVNFWKTYRKFKTSVSLPIIHCSDGSQRTGLLIALDSIMTQWEETSSVDIFSCAARMREDRIGFFSTQSEYVYLHQALVEAYLSQQNITEVASSGVKEIGPLNTGSVLCRPLEEIAKEFKVLERQRPIIVKTTSSSTCSTSNGNITPEHHIQATTHSYQLLFPSDTGNICVTCVPLLNQRKTSSSGERPSRLRHSVSLQENEIYLGIGGVVPSDCKSSFLVMPVPFSTMSLDFWQIIFDTGCRTVVMLTESDQTMTLQTDKELLYTPDFSISMTSQTIIRDTITETNMLMRSEIEPVAPFDCDIPSEVAIKMYNIEWSTVGDLVPSYDTLLLLFKRISRWLRQTASTLIAVHSNDDQSTSGHFCAAYNTISLLQMDNSVDVYLTAREVQDRLPQAISKDQYQHLYTICEKFNQQRQEQLSRLHSNECTISLRGDPRLLRTMTSSSSTDD